MKRAVKAWIDCPTPGKWGVEIDAKELTIDGHYICYCGEGEKGRQLAEIIADAINGRRLPKVNI